MIVSKKASPIRLLFTVGLFVLGVRSALAQASTRQVWLSGVDPVVQKEQHKDGPPDYMDLFKPDAPWWSSASVLKVFKISSQMVLRGSDEQLRTVIEDLKRRHVSLAIEMGFLQAGMDQCGHGVEGYSSPTAAESVAKRIKKLGGQIDYVAMDEPVWFGHIFGEGSGGRHGCRYPLDRLVEQITPKIAIMQRYFPSLKVGDIEPINPKWGGKPSIADFVAFDELLRKRLNGTPVFFHADIAWVMPGWKPLLEDAAGRLRHDGIRIGVICDGDEAAGTNEAWVQQALERCNEVQSDPHIDPSDLIVQSWEKLPTRMLPENNPGSMTFEVKHVRHGERNFDER